MKLLSINGTDSKNNTNINIKGKRVSKAVVSQLAANNKYSLTAPNQRYIIKSVEELSKVPGEKNIEFLMNVASKIKYSTNIQLQDAPKYDWKNILADALKKVIAITPFVNQSELNKKVDEILANHDLNSDEKEILNLKKSLLSTVNLEQIKKETVGGIKDFERNLDYFIVSSETTLEHKKYVLERLNYLMSYKYRINPQLKDKKSIVAAEMVNDMAIATPGHKIPNIKAVNQKQHGMCAAISIVRKKLAYEDKPNYVDSILSELEDSPYIKVYDRSKLGSGEKIEIKKIDVDYDAAISKGYRIIDASTMVWMQLSRHSGYSASSSNVYNPFDKRNFDVKSDSFFNAKFEDPELSSLQSYYQALNKVKSFIDDYKAAKIKKEVTSAKTRREVYDNLKTLSDAIFALRKKLEEIDGLAEKTEIEKFSNYLLSLEYKNSSKIPQDNRFAYIANEEHQSKLDKIRAAILSQGIEERELSDKKAEEIFDLIDFCHDLRKTTTPLKKNSLISRVRTLYEIGAGFRYQFVEGLNSDKVLNELMTNEKLPDKESLIIKTIDKLLAIIKSNKHEAKNLIIENLSAKLALDEPSARAVIKYLNSLKENMEFMLEHALDNINASLGMENKRAALSEFVENVLYEIKENKNESALNVAEENLGTKNEEDTILKLNELREKLPNSTEEEYNEIFNILGEHSQIGYIKQSLMELLNAINNAEDTEIMDSILTANGLSTENRDANGPDLLRAIASQIDAIDDSIEKYTEFLRIIDENGDVVYSPDPKDILIQRYESRKEIPSSTELRELQYHIDKIQKVQSQDEFNSRQGKISDKTLLKFSKSEKNTLSYIEKNINSFSRYVQKQLSSLKYYIKEPLEEINRQIGIEDGLYWVTEGGSGLMSGQQVRILEYITGRPHHVTYNIEEAIKDIKTSPYSGITSSSVFHDRIGMHAQYVADITPVKIKVKDENGNIRTEEKDVLFQDNTWGASEHENIWIDQAGLKRTDYSDNRGGSLGYITNENFQNGNYVDRILNEMVLEDKDEDVESKLYRKIKHPSREIYTSQQYTDVVLDGKSSKTSDMADSIHDTLFNSSANLLVLFPKFLSQMTVDDVSAKINDIKNRTYNWESKLDRINQKIFEPLSGGISSEEQYNRLPDNDELKVALEKTALELNYKMSGVIGKLAKVNNVKDLKDFKKYQIKRAQENFMYAFSKETTNLKWFLENISEKNMEEIDSILDKYSLKISDDDFEKIFLDYDDVDKNFTGSLKDSINMMSDELESKLKGISAPPEAIVELVDYFENLMKTKMYYTNNDLSNAGKDSNIVKFIDRVYDPEDDDEFVSIYRRLQDMTIKEFKSEVLSKVTKEELGIKDYDGYKVLKALKLYKKDAEDSLSNVLYQESLYGNYDYKAYNLSYDLSKFKKSAKYTRKHDFETIYTDMKDSLSYLSLPKLFNKYKNKNLIKYGAYPAYPKLDYMPESMLSTDFEFLSQTMPTTINQIAVMRNLLRYYELNDEINKIVKKMKDADIIADDEYKKLNLILGEIVTMVYDDETAKVVFEAASDAMELEEGSAYLHYKDYIKKINDFAEEYKKNCPIENINASISSLKDVLTKEIDLFTTTLIQKRYRGKLNLLIQKYKKSLIKRDGNEDIILNEIWSEYCKAYILNNPEEILDNYSLAAAKNSPSADMLQGYTALLDRALRYSVLYETQLNIMSAIKNGIETSVKTSFNDIEIPLLSGKTEKMGADDMVNQMVCNLILDNDMETALMFLDKFGLNEQYVKYTASNFDYDEVKKLMKKSTEAYNNFESFSKVYEEAMNTAYKSFDEGEDTIKTINILKRTLREASLKYSIDNKTKLISKAIDKAKEDYLNKKNFNPKEIISTLLPDAMGEVAAAEDASLQNINSILNVYEVMYSIANSINLKENCEAEKIRNEMNKQFNELQKYREDLDKKSGKQQT